MKPMVVMRAHCPNTAANPIRPISLSVTCRGPRLLTITLSHEPSTPYNKGSRIVRESRYQ